MFLKVVNSNDSIDGAVILDENGRSIVNLHSRVGEDGNIITTPVIDPRIAREIVDAVNAIETLHRMLVRKGLVT